MRKSLIRALVFISFSSIFALIVHVLYILSSPDFRAASSGPKYFHEIVGSLELAHYDNRFFSGVVSREKKTEYLRGLIHSYLDFCDAHRLETWLAHGTLLGWWWNGRLLPWDNDIDVQVSYETIQKLGFIFNQTTYTHEQTQTKYMLDVNSHFKDRFRGNGKNIIDARWIDTSTGLFIDITALAETDPAGRPGVIQCKNNHFYRAEEIYPLRRSTFEDRKAYVPFGYSEILQDEYNSKSLSEVFWNGHLWDPDFGIWIDVQNVQNIPPPPPP